MEKNPKVSVIIPTYNSAQFIVETLESVFAQTYKNYEVIVVDDGSTDNTKEVLKPYMSKIRYIYKENGGPASARNVGIKNARGEYIAFLDSDDLWLPEKLEKQVRYFEEHPQIYMVFADCIRFGEEVSNTPRNDTKYLISNDMFVNIWWYNIVPTSTVMVRKSCFEKVGFFDEAKELETTEDTEMWLRIARECEVGYLREVVTKYRVRMSGYSRSNINRAYNSAKLVIDKYWGDIKIRGYTRKFYDLKLHRHYLNYGLSLFSIGDSKGAHMKFKEALKYNPKSLKALFWYLVTSLNYKQIKLIKTLKHKLFR